MHSASSSAAKCDFADRPSSSFSSPGQLAASVAATAITEGGGERDCSLLAQTRRREKDTGRGLIAGKKNGEERITRGKNEERATENKKETWMAGETDVHGDGEDNRQISH